MKCFSKCWQPRPHGNPPGKSFNIWRTVQLVGCPVFVGGHGPVPRGPRPALPGAGPPIFAHCIANPVRPGACAGEGWAVFGTFDDRRGREATAGDLSARQVIESVPSRSAPAADIGRRMGCLKPGDGQKKANPEQPILLKKTVSKLDCLFWQRKSIHNGQNAGHCRHSVRQKGSYPVLLAFLAGGPHRAGR